MTTIFQGRSPTTISRSRRRRPSIELLETRQLLSTFVVGNTNDSGGGSLRRAILNSNADTAQTNLITFDLGTSGVLQTINLLSALPPITQSVTIEGPTDDSGNPLVKLNGAGAGSTTDGLLVQANDTTIESLTIVQFGGDGIDVSGSNDVIAGNSIGTDLTGTAGLGNGGNGVVVTGSNNQIIRSTAGYGNVITGNGGDAALITGAGATGNVVEGSHLGTDQIANQGVGILVNAQASHNLIGTNGDGANDSGERNFISGNASWGIQISGPGTQDNVVAGNFIGTGFQGLVAVPNGAGGVLINDGATANLIGTDGVSDANSDEGNLISGNNGPGAPGIEITDPGTNFNVVAGNLIGTDVSGENPMGNGGDGVSIRNGAQSNTIGGPTALANFIYFNAQNAVAVYDNATTGNTIRCNAIRANDELGIDLGGDGVTPNHVPPATSGPNNWENYPIITSAGAGTMTAVGISFLSLPDSTYTIDFYATPKGSGEGNRWLGSVSVTTDASGEINPPTTFNLAASTVPGQWITATATDQAGDTSEFSNAWELPTLPSQVTVTPSIASPAYGQSLTFTANVAPVDSGLPTPTGSIQFQVDGLDLGSEVNLANGAATSIATTALSAGPHMISAVYSGDPTYTTYTETSSQTVTPAPLTITADDKSKVYGAADPVLTYTPSGTLYYGDAYSVITGVTLSTTTGAAATAGTHAIIASGGTAANYTITDVNGTLTVKPSALVSMINVKPVLNSKKLVTQILIVFSGPVNVAEAKALGTYRLATAGAKNSFDARNARVITLKSATYNPINHTVTLTPRKAFALTKTVQLRVNGQPPSGLRDSVGRLIDGDHNRQPGGNAVALLRRGGATISAVVSTHSAKV